MATHDVWGTNNGARAMQTTADTDFQLQTRFLSTPTQKFQLQGLLVEQDADNWLRFDTYSDGSKLYAFAAITVNGSSSVGFKMQIPGGSAPYVQVTRAGDLWTMEYSTDGTTWVTAGSFTHAMTVTSAGVFAGNTGQATGFTAQVDYFENTADPIADEDGTTEPVNAAPVAGDDGLATNQDVPLSVAVASDLLGNDSDADGDALSLDSFTQPVNGVLTDNGDGTLSYTPNVGYNGVDTFAYTVTDGTLTDTATVSVTVNSTEPVNAAPVAGDDGLATDQDVPLSVAVASDLLGNDSDADGDALSLDSFTQPVNGVLTDNGDGTLSYTPNVGYNGVDTFAYTVTDGTLTDTATATVVVSDSPPDSALVSDDFSAVSALPSSFILTADTGSGGTGASSGEFSFAGTDRAVMVDLSTDTYAFAAKIMPSGDSLTVGVVDGSGSYENLEGFRLDLFETVISAGGWIDYVGVASNGPEDMLDTDNAAVGGTTVRQAAGEGQAGAADVSEATAAYKPDIGLMMLGTNDILDATNFPVRENGTDALSAIMTEYESLVGQFFANADAGAHLVVSTIAPRVDRGREAIASEYFNEGYSIVGGELVVGDAGNGTYKPGLIATIAELQGTYSSLLLFENPHANFTIAGSPESLDHLSRDGLHWTQDAYAEYADALYALLETEIGMSAGTLGGTVQTLAPEVVEIYGSNAGDRIIGDADDNIINGGAGSNLLEGGAGADSFVFDSSALGINSFNRIADFKAAEGDVIDVSAISSQLGLSDAQAQESYSFVGTPAGVKLMLTHGGTTYHLATLAGLSLGDIGLVDPVWSIEGPSGTSATSGANSSDAWLSLVTPDGDYDVWGTNNGARAMQTTADTDFQLQTRFLSTPTQKFQLQGLLVEQDADNWLRFDTYSDGSKLYAFAAITVNGSSSVGFKMQIPGGSAPYVQVTRAGDLWTMEYSTDGTTWVTAGSFTHAMTVTSAGVFAGNTGQATGFTAQVDYFENTADPIADEDGTTEPVNAAPVAGDDGLATNQDVPLSVAVASDLLGNDSDADGDALSLDSFTQPVNGVLTDNGDGTLSYTPNVGYNGVDTFAYTVTDGTLTDTATVSVTVNSTEPVNAAPVAGDDGLATNQDVPLSVAVASDLLGNDSDADGDALSLDSFTQPVNGVLTDNGDGTLSYTPNVGYNGVDTFAYTVTDGTLTDTATVSVTVNSTEPVNAAPVAGDDGLATNQDVPLSVAVASDLLGNDSDADGDALSLDSFTQPVNGVLTDNGDGTLSYTPNVGYNGVDTFAYTVTDGTLTDTATVSVTVNSTEPVNAAPVAGDDGLATDQDVPLSVAVASDLLGNDSDADGDALSLDSFTQPVNGVLTDNGDGTLSYTPNVGYNGVDTFAYTVTDGTLTDTATVSVTVNSTEPPPPASDAVSDDFSDGVLAPVWSIEGPGGTSVNLANNATDAFLQLVTPDGNHDVWGTNNGARAMQTTADTDFQLQTRFLSTPTQKFQLQGLLVEQDADNWLRFDTYSDGSKLYAFAAITVNGSSSVGFKMQIPGGSAPYVQVTRAGDLWTMEYSTDGTTWVTAGSFTHAMTVTSAGVFAGNTGQATGFTAQVDYFENTADPIADEDGTTEPVNAAPVAGDDGLATDQDVPLSVAVASDLLGNDSDADGDALSLDSFTQPVNGVLTDNGDGTLSYTPNVGYNGVDTFAYTVTDGTLTDTATVSVTVNSTEPVNAAPVAGDDGLATDQDVPLSVAVASDLLGNDSDADGDALSLDSFTQPVNGVLTDNGDGTLSYTPNVGYNGVDTFAYTVTDGTLTDTATVSVTVNSTEPPPPASDAVSDDFSDGVLAPVWSIEGPGGTSVNLANNATDAFLQLVTPDGNHDVWGTNNGARAMQILAIPISSSRPGFCPRRRRNFSCRVFWSSRTQTTGCALTLIRMAPSFTPSPPSR